MQSGYTGDAWTLTEEVGRNVFLNEGWPDDNTDYLLSGCKEMRSATSCPGTVGKAVLAALSGVPG